ncbi:hypothetical protein G6F32_016324 [Rhizopus arrhizus]|nr:hypothetical protein G6F32_016324 [Rhizopus arrhizus]
MPASGRHYRGSSRPTAGTAAAAPRPLQAPAGPPPRSGLVEAAVAVVDDHRADVGLVQHVLQPGEGTQLAAGQGPAAATFQMQQGEARRSLGGHVVHHRVAAGIGFQRPLPVARRGCRW